MNNIAIVAYETEPAICSSMMMHVNMMSDAGFDVIFFLQKNINKDLFSHYVYKIVSFDHPRELRELFDRFEITKVWCTNPMYVLKLVRVTKLPIYLWKQGDTAAESFMAHHSYLRKWVLQLIDAYTLRRIAGVIYVSDAMKRYYESKYHISTKSIVVPCLSEFPDSETNGERIPDSYVYIGGLSVWQCFDEIIQIYSKIRKVNSVFHIITFDTERARQQVMKFVGDTKNIHIYGIKDRETIPSVLNKFQYGFLIRKKDTVNHVAAPIKFLEYLSCGVNVIMTDAIPSYSKIVQDYNVGSIIDMSADNITINEFNPSAKVVHNKLFNRKNFVEIYKDLFA